MSYIDSSLYQTDPQLAKLLEGEFERQTTTLQMIPSENYASKAVLQTMGSVLTNKYAEGYPGKRYYNGCGYYDMIENLAIERAKNLFKAEHVNVQLHTGTQSNLAAYYAFIEPGDIVMAMRVDQGGHLTHGKKENFSGKLYNFQFYGVSEKDYRIDYDEVRRLARKVKPKLIVAGASAYPRIIEFDKFREIADEVGAFLMTDIAHIVGLVAAKLHPDPVPIADVVTTTTHKTLRGPRGAIILTKKKYAEAIDRAVFPGVQAGPLMHQIAAKAVCFQEAKSFGFKEYQKQILLNASALAETLLSEGFNLITGGTDNHLMMVDLSEAGLTGREAADLLEEAGIIVNFNSIPYDKKPPMVTSGIRPGTPALTTRGMKEEEMQLIGKMFSRVLNNPGDEKMRVTIAGEVRELCDQFPIYRDLLQW